jgi:hypothetical protein
LTKSAEPPKAGALVLRKLSDLASASIIGASAAQDSVAFALSEIFSLHSEDMDERPVTSDDAYRLTASGEELFSEAVKFIEMSGSEEDAIRLVAGLARLTPDRLYGRWPPDISN